MSNGPTTTDIEVETLKRSPEEIAATRREVVVSQRTGMLVPQDLSQALELAQSMAKASQAVPAHLRGHPGACLAIIEYANSWGMTPFAVANQSYVVSDRLCFMGQLVHSVIKARADLKYPKLGLETEYTGKIEDGTRKLRVFAECYIDDARTVTRVLEWESPMLKDIKPQNSPLWKTDPDQQLFYRTSQRWQRRHKPEILLGVYSKEEFDDMPEDERAAMARDVTPPKGTGLIERLAGRNHGEGFQAGNVENLKGEATTPADELANIAPDTPETSPPATQQAAHNIAYQQAQQAQQAAHTGVNSGLAATSVPTDPTPSKPAEPAKEEPKGPTDAPGYVAYLALWLAATKDDARIHDRYQEEKEMRTRCSVMGDDMKECQRLKKARLTELGSA